MGPLEHAAFKRGFAHIDRGDTLVMLTDGLLEREDGEGEAFGEDRVSQCVIPRLGQPAEAIAEALWEAAQQHGGGRPWRDDVTAIIVSREG